MDGQILSELMSEIEAFAETVQSHKPFPIAGTEAKSLDIKVFETNSENTRTWEELYYVGEYVELAKKFGVNFYVKIEWRDVEDTKGKPYFLFF